MKYILLALALIFGGSVVWMNVTVPSETGVKVLRGDTGSSVICDGTNQPATYRKLQKLFHNVASGDSFQISIELLSQNGKLRKSEVSVRVFPNREVSMQSDDDVGAITSSPSRGSSSGGSGDYIAMMLMSEICYVFMSDESKERAARDVERLLGYELPTSGEQVESPKP